jgi:small-conductance mechanosensitive channel
MALTYTALGIVIAMTVFTVIVGSFVVLRPLLAKPYRPGDWIVAMAAGLATAVAGAAGIAWAFNQDVSYVSWSGGVVAGVVTVFGLVLTAIGIWIYTPDPSLVEDNS